MNLYVDMSVCCSSSTNPTKDLFVISLGDVVNFIFTKLRIFNAIFVTIFGANNTA